MLSMMSVEERPPDVPAVEWDIVALLTNNLEEIGALRSSKRDAAVAGDPVAAQLFDQIERRLREEVGQLQELLEERQEAGVLPPDFAMPKVDDDVDD